jgi:hypothetical protein
MGAFKACILLTTIQLSLVLRVHVLLSKETTRDVVDVFTSCIVESATRLMRIQLSMTAITARY